MPRSVVLVVLCCVGCDAVFGLGEPGGAGGVDAGTSHDRGAGDDGGGGGGALIVDPAGDADLDGLPTGTTPCPHVPTVAPAGTFVEGKGLVVPSAIETVISLERSRPLTSLTIEATIDGGTDAQNTIVTRSLTGGRVAIRAKALGLILTRVIGYGRCTP